MRKLSATILLIVFVLAVQGYAQSITGSLNGRVVDQQGSAVPNARVTATELTKKLTVATNSTGAGDFVATVSFLVSSVADGCHEFNRRGRFLDRRIGAGQLHRQCRGGRLQETDAFRRSVGRQRQNRPGGLDRSNRGSHRDGRSQRHGDDTTDGKQRTRLRRHRHADCEHQRGRAHCARSGQAASGSAVYYRIFVRRGRRKRGEPIYREWRAPLAE